MAVAVQSQKTVEFEDLSTTPKPQFEGREITVHIGRPTTFTEQVSRLFGNAVSWTNLFFNIAMYMTLFRIVFVDSDKAYADLSNVVSKGYNGMVDGVVKIIEAVKK